MREEQVDEKRFVVDHMLGKMAKWLRILGFDTRYERLKEMERVKDALAAGFIVITRNGRWCGEQGVIRPCSNDSMEQLREVVSIAGVSVDEVWLLRRCVVCNGLLERVSRDHVFGLVPDYVFETNVQFHQCPDCKKVYWPGSHPKRMMEQLRRLLGWRL